MLLNPNQISQAIRESQIPLTPQLVNPSGPKGQGRSTAQSELDFLLQKTNLSTEEVLENVSSLMRSAEQASVRMKAAETALKLNGHLSSDDSDGRRDFQVTIIINDGQHTGTNPILIPRNAF